VAEEAVDGRRYVLALRRHRLLILATVLLVTGTALAASLLMPSRYEATSTVLLRNTFSQSDDAVIRRELITASALMTTNAVLSDVAEELPGESVRSLQADVSASSDPDANLVKVTATESTPDQAATVANLVVSTFLEHEESAQNEQLRREREALVQRLAVLEGEPGQEIEIEAIQNRIAELALTEATGGSEYDVVEQAQPPASPSSPRPVLAAVIAFGVSLFLAVVFVLLRDRLRGSPQSARELEDLTDLPLLGVVPSRGRFRANASQRSNAYGNIRAVLALGLPAYCENILLLTAVRPADDTGRFAVELARAFEEVGKRTLIVSTDSRLGRLDQLLGTQDMPGLVDLVAPDGVEATADSVEASFDGVVATVDGVLAAASTPELKAESMRLRRMFPSWSEEGIVNQAVKNVARNSHELRTRASQDGNRRKSSPNGAEDVHPEVGSHIVRVDLDEGAARGSPFSVDVLPSGSRLARPDDVFARDAFGGVFLEIRRLSYDFILVDGPPLTRAIETHLIAKQADGVVLVVSDRATRDDVADAGDVIGRLPTTALGMVVVGDAFDTDDVVRTPPLFSTNGQPEAVEFRHARHD
jgi:capsular polysaccharide biosynthesis protein/Mrp family chromosome partitioning ATPase